MSPALPIAIIGAGPIGLAAAAHLTERKQPFVVLESGGTVASAIESWQHVKLFSTWQYNLDRAAQRLLESQGEAGAIPWERPRATQLPTGRELIDTYLAPLAAHPAIAPHLRFRHRVTAITRASITGGSFDKTRTTGREAQPFLVRFTTPNGEGEVLARAVIDATGTWHSPNPVGRSGIPAIGEAAARKRATVTAPLPDPLGAERARFAGKRILVLGSGHSAATTLIALGRLRQQEPSTEILWGIRAVADANRLFGGGAADELPARGQLGVSLRRLVDSGAATLVEGVSVTALTAEAGNAPHPLTVDLADGRTLQVDLLVPATGFRPDHSITSELRLALDDPTEAPIAIGSLIAPEFHSCGTVPAHGATALAHPERNFYTVGAKSYGRAPTFLLATGYEQVRSVAAELSGDGEAARAVHLSLPQTGVCSAG